MPSEHLASEEENAAAVLVVSSSESTRGESSLTKNADSHGTIALTKRMEYDEELKEAIAEGSMEKVQEMLAKTYDVNCRDEKAGSTPLLTAALYKHESLIIYLLEHEAHPGAKDRDGDTTLHRLSKTVEGLPPPSPPTKVLIDVLFQHKPPLDTRNNELKTPLMLAALRGYIELVKQLIHHGADILARDSDGVMPLHFAASGGCSPEVVTLLIKEGAPVDATSTTLSRLTPLHYAASSPNTTVIAEVVKRLLQAGANREAVTGIEKLTPLHCAAAECGLSTVKILLDHGANPCARTKSLLLFPGKKPADMPSSSYSNEIRNPIKDILKEAEKAWKKAGKK